MNTPRVSVVMAAKNYAKFLPVAVDSVFAQTFRDWELIIIDDGSTDATPGAVRPYLHDARVKYTRADRLGQSRAKNLGIALSRAEFIAYLDADDAWHPTKLEKQLQLLEAQPRVGVCYSLRSLINDRGEALPTQQQYPERGKVLSKILLRNFVCFSSVMVRRVVFEHVGWFDPHCDLSIDYDLWLRVAKHYELDYVPEELVLYRTGHGNLSQKLTDRVATALSIMHRALFRRGLDEVIPPAVVAEGYASTCQTLGYIMRGSEPREALRWYARALRWPALRQHTLRGILGVWKTWMLKARVPGSAENASVNR